MSNSISNERSGFPEILNIQGDKEKREQFSLGARPTAPTSSATTAN